MNIVTKTLLEGILNPQYRDYDSFYDSLFEGYDDEYNIFEDIEGLYYGGVITEAMHPDLQGIPKKSIQHLIGGAFGGGGSMSKLHSEKMTAGLDMFNGSKVKEHQKNGVKHFAIKDSKGNHVMTVHDDGDRYHVVHNTDKHGTAVTLKKGELKHHVNGALEQHAKTNGLDRKKDFSLHAINLGTEERKTIKSERFERKNYEDKLETIAAKSAGKLFDKHSALNNGLTNPDDMKHVQLAKVNEGKHKVAYEKAHETLKKLTDHLTHPDTVSDPKKLREAHDALRKHMRQMDDVAENHVNDLMKVHNQHSRNSEKNESPEEMKERFGRAKDSFVDNIRDSKESALKALKAKAKYEKMQKQGNHDRYDLERAAGRVSWYNENKHDAKESAMKKLVRYRG